MAKCISDDVFVSMTASCSSQSWEYCCRVFNFSWISARPWVAFLTVYQLGHMVAVPFWSGSLQSSTSSLQILHWSPQTWLPAAWLKTLWNYVLYFIPYLTNKFRNILLPTWMACLSTNWWKENWTKRIRILSLSKLIFTENNANRQSWCCESFTEDNDTKCSTYLLWNVHWC